MSTIHVHVSKKHGHRTVDVAGMGSKKSDYLRNQDHPTVLGYELDRSTLTPIRRTISGPLSAPAALSPSDKQLFEKYGSVEKLEAAGFAGLADRIRRGAKTADDNEDNIAPGYQDRKTADAQADEDAKVVAQEFKSSGKAAAVAKAKELATGQPAWAVGALFDKALAILIPGDGREARLARNEAIRSGRFVAADSADRREPPTIDSIGEEKGLAAGKPVNTEWLRLDKLTPEALAAEAKSEGIKGEGKTDLIMAILRKNFSTAQFDAWSLFY